MNNKSFKNKKLFQGMGAGYIICLTTHILSALLPMYIVFPFAEQLFGHGESHSHGLLADIFSEMLIITVIIIPVALLTWLGHKLVRYFKCKCGGSHEHEENPCENCPYKK